MFYFLSTCLIKLYATKLGLHSTQIYTEIEPDETADINIINMLYITCTYRQDSGVDIRYTIKYAGKKQENIKYDYSYDNSQH